MGFWVDHHPVPSLTTVQTNGMQTIDRMPNAYLTGMQHRDGFQQQRRRGVAEMVMFLCCVSVRVSESAHALLHPSRKCCWRRRRM